ncbi:MAG: 1-acyl-sn-glycerol-3-phosphate acyltransferase [Rhodospirillales bacterium]|nr:1-acyl-sn-glycerol-3-phosphate acyltransferase [Rhodospirillales bacterium]
MRLLRSAAFNLFFYALSAAMLLALPLVRRRGGAALQAYVRCWARLVLGAARRICGISWRVVGTLPAGPALIASRHQSAFDTIVWFLLLASPAPTPAYVLKRELTRLPLVRGLCDGLGLIVVDRGAGQAAIRALLRGADAAMRAGRTIVIFPEGTRAPPGTMLPLQPGVAALAQRTGLPVVPVATDSGDRWGRRAFFKNPGVITIAIREALPAGLPREALMRELTTALAAPPCG